MSRYLDTLRRRSETRHNISTFSDYLAALGQFSFNGNQYVGPVSYTYSSQKVEAPDSNFTGYVQGVYKSDGVVFGCMAARELLLSETRFKFRRYSDKGLYGSPALSPLESPWTTGTTGDLLRRMEQDGSLAGNAYIVRVGPRLRRLNPGRVALLVSSEMEPDDPDFAWDVEVEGIVYNSRNNPTVFAKGDYVHYTPNPDPEANFRGMSWMTPVIREITSDLAATKHKQAFFEHAATPNLAVKLPESVIDPEQYRKIKEAMEDSRGATNAYKTLYLMAGADVTVVGAAGAIADLKQVQGAYESRICMAARVPAAIAGASEGLQGSSLNSGNFGQARRQFADGYYHPTIKDICSVLSPLVNTPAGSELWYDTSDIPFLREDQKDAAEIMQTQMQAVRQGIEGGFDPDAVVEAVTSLDLSKLKSSHSGLTSVQLQPPMTADSKTPDTKKQDKQPTETDVPSDTRVKSATELAILLQKMYLAVGVIITAEEARSIVKRAGGDFASVIADVLPDDLVPSSAPVAQESDPGDNEAPAPTTEDTPDE